MIRRQLIATVLLVSLGISLPALCAALPNDHPDRNWSVQLLAIRSGSSMRYPAAYIGKSLNATWNMRMGLEYSHDDLQRTNEYGLAFPSTSEHDLERDVDTFTLNIALIRSFLSEEHFSWYFGAGSLLSYSSYDIDQDSRYNYVNPDLTSQRSSTTDQWGYGIGGTVLMGIRWQFHPRVSLNTEYQVRATCNRSKQKSEFENSPDWSRVTGNAESVGESVWIYDRILMGLTYYF